MSEKRSKLSIYFPIILALAITVGILIGFGLSQNIPQQQIIQVKSSSDKMMQVLRHAEKEYVDTINMDPLVEESIQHFLQELDPHSYYLGKDQIVDATEKLDGNFEGVGIEFRIQNDSLVVVNPIAGGPSAKVGLLAGDRITIIDGDTISGPELKNQKVMKMLKGEGGTEVDVTVYRRNSGKSFDFTITRGTIPINSVDVALKLNKNTGYVKITRFAERTYEEMIDGLDKLDGYQLENLILDFRNNGGGYLTTATRIADEFLSKDKMIVYTEGKSQKRKEYKATRRGNFEEINLIVLINENSASASEIVAGAMQDNDRATVIGRRSFGKGLVQEPMRFSDGTVVRLTVARYYMPSGRCIQKPYGVGIDYDGDYIDRYDSGELLSEDSVAIDDSLSFYTSEGRIVYGSSGIMPDIFVPIDTTYTSDYFYEIAYQGLINQFAFDYSDKNRSAINNQYKSSDDFAKRFFIDEEIENEFHRFADENGVKRNVEGFKKAENEIKSRLKSNIARVFWQNEGYYKCSIVDDPILNKCLEHFREAGFVEK